MKVKQILAAVPWCSGLLVLCVIFSTSVLCSTLSAAELWQSAQQYSKVELTTPDALAKGKAKVQKVTVDGIPDYLCVESLFVLPLPPDQVLTRLQKMQQTAEELDVPFSNPAVPDDFRTFQAANTAQWSFWGGSLADPRRQNLSDMEKKILSEESGTGGDAAISNAWRKILLNRARSYQKKGLMAAEPYQFDKDSFQPGPELVEFLKKREPVLNRFMPLLDSIMSGREIPHAEPVLYHREDTRFEGKQAVALSAFYALPGESLKTAEITFYVSSQYNISLILYELFPVTINGKNQTYVWRGDYVITPVLSFAKGIEQMAAQNIMVLEIQKSIQDFSDDCRKVGGS